MTFHPHRSRVQAATGFVIAELLLALAISTMIGVTVLAMLFALGSATDKRHDIRRAIVKRQVAATRIGAMIRSAARVLDQDAGSLVLWIGDATENGEPNLSELRRIEWDQDDQSIRSFEAPADLDPGADVSYELDSDFNAITEALEDTASFPGRTVLQQVSTWSLTLDDPVIASVRTVDLRLTLAHDSGEDEAIIIASLRATPP